MSSLRNLRCLVTICLFIPLVAGCATIKNWFHREPKPTNLNVRVLNNSGQAITVKVVFEGSPSRSDEVFTVSASATDSVHRINKAPSEKAVARATYFVTDIGESASFKGSDVRYEGEPDSDFVVSVPRTERFDPAASAASLTAAIESLGLDKPLDDTVFSVSRDMSRIWIGEVTDTTARPAVPKMTIADIPVKFEASAKSDMSFKATASSIANLSVTIPVYGGIKASMTGDSIYDLKFTYVTSKYKNSELPADLPNKLTEEQRKQVRKLLGKPPTNDMKVVYIDSVECVSRFAWSAVKGRKVATQVEVNAMAIVSTNGAYAFAEQDSQMYSIDDTITKIRFSYLSGKAVANWLDAIKQGKIRSLPPKPKFFDETKPGFNKLRENFLRRD